MSSSEVTPRDEDQLWAERLRGALKDEPRVDVLSGVQHRLRERSGGKFYSDGWTTVRHAPGPTYLVTGILMLAVLFVLYAVLVPIAGDLTPAPELKPVQVLVR
jgi:hypothetical protein